MMPASSQWPVVLSFPFERSIILPKLARGARAGPTPRAAAMFPSPRLSRCGSDRPPTASAVFLRVLLPSSPYTRASGSSPIPTPSRTISRIFFVIESRLSFAAVGGHDVREAFRSAYAKLYGIYRGKFTSVRANSGVDLFLVALADLHTTLVELVARSNFGPFRRDHQDRLEDTAARGTLGTSLRSSFGCLVGE